MIKQKLLSRLCTLEKRVDVSEVTRIIKVVFIEPDGSESKTAEPIIMTVNPGARHGSWRGRRRQARA